MADRDFIPPESGDARPELTLVDEVIPDVIPPEPPERGPRRRLLIVIGVIAAIVVYALAFDYTNVDLAQVSSETRQQSLTRILRALARPELVTYDQERVITELDVAVPCGAATPVTSSNGISLSPTCAAPGEIITITGEGFDAGERVTLSFVPDTEFDITLPLRTINAEDDGTFSFDATVPDRESENAQQIQVLTADPIGTWGDRVEVWTDTNENGVRDPAIIENESLDVTLDARLPDVPAVAIVDGSDVVEFISYGDAFTATSGIANREIAVPESEFDPGPNDLYIAGIAGDGNSTTVTLNGPNGFDTAGWRLALYDATTTELVEVTAVSDLYQLSPRISETTWVSLDRIIETVFLALVATSAGLLLAIPLSFISARNIMADISSTITNLALGVISVPIGGFAGIALAGFARSLTEPLRSSWFGDVIGIGVLAAAILFIIRWAVPPVEDEPPTRSEKVAHRAGLIGAGILGLVAFVLISDLLGRFGTAVAPSLGVFSFLGEFFATLGEIFSGLTTVVATLAGAGVLVNLASKAGYALRHRLSPVGLRPLNVALAMIAGSIFAVGIMAILDWFYRFQNPTITLRVPIAVGAILGLLLAIKGMATGQVNVGLATYTVARTVFNTLRAIEPLVMAIVFVTWVGIGPFAGSLALTLHTAAALAKLYSEQVESISAGPIEAIRATGATRLQTIVYGVVPQIIPPYISFTMYRWDINVRMSTILGFVGGGGIGLILQQNVNLLQYRAAAVQMLFIAIVVASMDYLSSRLRRRLV
ncbi:MAG TPA: ABC transporter permease subunit [Acidimicrobiia bacterium]